MTLVFPTFNKATFILILLVYAIKYSGINYNNVVIIIYAPNSFFEDSFIFNFFKFDHSSISGESVLVILNLWILWH